MPLRGRVWRGIIMFELCERGVRYDDIPVYRKRWCVVSLFFGEALLLALLYYLPGGFHAVLLTHPVIRFVPLLAFWGAFAAILCSANIYAFRKNYPYKIASKPAFTVLLAGCTAAAAGIVAACRAVLRTAPENVKDIVQTVMAWAVQLLDGSRITLWLTVLAVSAGLVGSLFLALGKMSKKAWINKACSAYVFFFRGTPLLMQLYFIYYGLPQITPVLTINNRFIAAFIAFSLNSAAYCAEIIRAAILSIDKGQFEAAKALRMSYGQTMSLVIIPQSIRRLIPPVGNEFIMMLKDASLVSIIALTDITKVTRSISSSTASAMVYIPAMILYLIITAIFSSMFHTLEKKYSAYV